MRRPSAPIATAPLHIARTRSARPQPWLGSMMTGRCDSCLMMAMAHDYRIMNPHKGFLCLNELDFGAGLKARLDVFNVFGSGDNAAEYFYTDRLPGEPADGVADLHFHPFEPRSFRFTVSKAF